ncbi:MAG: ABC-type multidrug transport system, permease component [uncultured Thiotrichaceae bacterium]|uniref:Transport permease protein n=1 Tax=uncultured Thiotrichaceae bacterium TaxID=298394 RepID=A0A6S6TID9_9GAMM|nr:MAG: ABC-type multidrug transport system, permease component [uncultured Thiotrichaceae bacterium]
MTLNAKWVAYRTIVTKEALRFIRIWVQTVLPPAITTILYFVIFGNLIGGAIGEVQGYTYSQFIAPGLIMMAVINNSYANVVSSFFSAKFHGNIQEMLISPIPGSVVLLGYISGGVVRGILVGILVSGVAMFFTDIRIHNIWIVISIVLLTSSLLAQAGFINAYYAKSFDGMNIIPIFILGPLTYLGGVFYSIDMLPEFWQEVSLLNPILYMINAFRYGFLGISDVSIAMSFAILIIVNITLFSLSLYLLKHGRSLRD